MRKPTKGNLRQPSLPDWRTITQWHHPSVDCSAGIAAMPTCALVVQPDQNESPSSVRHRPTRAP